MGLLDLLRRPEPEGRDLSLDALVRALGGKASADKIYDPGWAPRGGWDAWCSWAYMQGKVHRFVNSLAKNAMSYELAASDGDEAALELVRAMERRVHLKTRLVSAYVSWLVHGRALLEPAYEVTTVAGREASRELLKVKVLDPATIRVFRNGEKDAQDLSGFLKEHPPEGGAPKLEAGGGDEVIGYIQHWNRRSEGKAVLFLPEELIFIPRYPAPGCPDGISLLRANYAVIMNKLGVERYQAIMARRFTDPKLKFTVPKDWWGRLPEVRAAIEATKLAAGTDFYLPEGTDIGIVESQGQGSKVAAYQAHLEDQFTAGMGFSDSFTSSGSSNRSVGEVQLQFWERDVRPERAMWAESLEDELVGPYVRARLGEGAKPPRFEFEDLTPQNEIEWAKALIPYLPFMAPSQLRRVFQDIGYPLGEGEEPRQPAPQAPALFSKDLTTAAGVPRPVLRGSATARDDLQAEIRRLREEMQQVLGP